MKASERRAQTEALRHARCPVCNRMGRVDRHWQTCQQCGAQVKIVATYIDRPYVWKPGFRKVATVTLTAY